MVVAIPCHMIFESPRRSLQRLLLFSGVCCLATDVCADGATGTLVGRLQVRVAQEPTPRPTMNAYVGAIGSQCCESSPDRRTGDPREFVLYINGLLTDNNTDAERPAELAQVNQQFEPHVLGVTVGSTVTFPNKDPLFHNVFSYSKTKRFDLGKYGEGDTRTVTFDTPGLVQVFCEIHSNMSANILVAPSSFVTQPDRHGNFAIANLPVGEHTVSIWHPDRGLVNRVVHITSAGTTLDLDF
jgi:plastocyanin